VTYVFLLNLGLENNKSGSKGGLGRHVEPRTSSSGVKSLTMLKSFLISSGVLPLIMLATVLHPTSLRNSVRDQGVACTAGSDAQQGLDVEVVGGEDNLEQHLLINGDELLVPFADIGRSLPVLVRVGLIGGRQGLATVVLAILQNLRDQRDQSTRASA
jgi:hypothetical protein